MADLNEQGAPPVDEVEAGAELPAAEAVEPSQPNETEQRARAMGWVDKAEYKGPADKWRPADEFVQRGENEVPILRERTKVLADKVTKQEQEFAARTAALERMAVQALQRQREDLNARYEAAIQQAVEVADVNRYHELNRGRQEALYNFDVQAHEAIRPQQQPASNLVPPDHPDVAQWRQANRWFDTDPELASLAVAFTQRNAKANPSISLTDNLRAAEEHVRKVFPDAFPQRRGGPAPVEGGNRMASGGRPGKTAADLPPEARQFAASMVKDGVYKSVDAYAKDYFSQ
jgi:hypothetical protein